MQFAGHRVRPAAVGVHRLHGRYVRKLEERPRLGVAGDRAGGYSEAVDPALPAARQASDRWHLLSNLRDNVKRLLYTDSGRNCAKPPSKVKRWVTLGRQGLRRSSQRSWERLSAQQTRQAASVV
ncbi:hypothetical protein ACTMU2_17465 [Cupriavidus basilensis]